MLPEPPTLTRDERIALLRVRHLQALHRAEHGIRRSSRVVSASLGQAIDRCRIERGLPPVY